MASKATSTSHDVGDGDISASSTVFPSLFHEALEAAIMSAFVFIITRARELARNGQLPTDILQLPLGPGFCDNFFLDHINILREGLRRKDYQFSKELLTTYMEDREWRNGTEIHYVEDENQFEECVYLITTNSVLKTITVCFRGSITAKDWVTDAKVVRGNIPNPLLRKFSRSKDASEEQRLEEDEALNDELGLHLGFRNYLYFDAPSILPTPLQTIGEKVPVPTVPAPLQTIGEKLPIPTSTERETKENKVDVIMQQIHDLREKYPGYRLYFNGHSLGGALSLITAVEAAVRFGTKRDPVSCVVVANPRPGDRRFQGAVHWLEREGLLRCMIVHNHLDLVPLLPDSVFSNRTFCQQGVRLSLYPHGFSLRYLGGHATRWEKFHQKLKHAGILLSCWVRMAKHHDYGLYLERLDNLKSELSKLHLDEMYDEVFVQRKAKRPRRSAQTSVTLRKFVG